MGWLEPDKARAVGGHASQANSRLGSLSVSRRVWARCDSGVVLYMPWKQGVKRSRFGQGNEQSPAPNIQARCGIDSFVSFDHSPCQAPSPSAWTLVSKMFGQDTKSIPMNESLRHPVVHPLLNLSLDQARALDYFELCDKAWSAVGSACSASGFKVPDGVEAREEDLFIEHLPVHWRTAFAVHEMEYDVLSGGFSSFFFNHGEHLVSAASCGLLEIGASKHQSILNEAAKHIDDDESLSPLDAAFYDTCESDGDPREMLAAYIVERLPLFAELPEA